MQNGNNRRLCIILWVLALGWGAVLFVFSGQTGPESGNLSRMFTEWLLRVFPGLPWTVWQLEPVLRKLAHFSIFALEGCLLGAAMVLTLRRFAPAILLSAAACAVVAGLNEYHQTFTEGRNASFIDVLIDSAGALAGIMLAALVLYVLKRRRRNVII